MSNIIILSQLQISEGHTVKKAFPRCISLQCKSYLPNRLLIQQLSLPAVSWALQSVSELKLSAQTSGKRKPSPPTVNPRAEGSSKRIQAMNSCHIVHSWRAQGVGLSILKGREGVSIFSMERLTSVVYAAGAEHVGLSLTKHQYSLNKAFPSSKQALEDHWSPGHRLGQLAELSDGLALPWLPRAAETPPQRNEKDTICSLTQNPLNTNSLIAPSAT